MATKNDDETKQTSRVGVACVLLVAFAWMVSSARLRTQASYGKDDYRGAVRMAKALSAEFHAQILWAADEKTAYYYGMQVRDTEGKSEHDSDVTPDSAQAGWPVSSEAVSASNWTIDDVRSRLAAGPVILVLSKADLYDKHQAWSTVLHEHHAVTAASTNAFALYRLQ